MKSVILAAGISARLRPLTDHIPKCLLKIGDKTILERTLDNLLAYHLNDIAIVTGYLEEQIKNFVARYYPQLNVTYIRNNKYDTTNNIYSLWMTKDLVINNDMLLMDSDILCDKRILALLLQSKYPNCLALRSEQKRSEEGRGGPGVGASARANPSATVDLKHA